MSHGEREAVVVTENEMKIQRQFIDKVKEINEAYYKETGKRRKMFTKTYGCQMNSHDSEKIQGMLFEIGYELAENEQDADLIVYNTCCVRENAENKVYGNLGILKSLKKKKRDLKIVLCGCMMQQETVIEKILQSHRHVDVIFGTYNLHRFPELLYTHFETGKPVIDVWEEHGEIIEDLPIVRQHPFKASVNIMYGCNNYCSYCIVPYVRGRERSREPQDIVLEIEKLVADGVKDITLLGQNVNSYGLGLGENVTFASLLRQINAIEGLERLRFLTSHPKDLSDDLILAMKECHKICNHLHLPMQSGSNAVLKKMNRQYTREHYMELIEKLKASIPDISLTTDLIIGFPGETEQDVLDTIEMIQKVRFAGAFTFIYSVRSGTPAANMKEQIPEEIVKERFNRVLDALNPIILEINQTHIGKTLKVLVDSVNEGGNGILTGRSEDNCIVHFAGDEKWIGEIVNVKITDCKTFYLTGELA